MNAVEIIAKKRDGKKLSRDEISYFITNYLKGEIKDYQMSAFLMATYFNSMDFEETGWLTDIMLNSGDKVIFKGDSRLYIDKHSTGGIGDKVSLVLAPWVAACGLKVPMLSGRGLGHTGGTLDKLESIPGYRTNLSLDEFKAGVETVGCVITGQTAEIAPADKLMYALRDVTATVESIPLICGSILSKKFAAGPRGLVFDVKCGNGAFMKNVEMATELAENLIGVTKAMGKSARALVTDMNQPLGSTAGNILEVWESVEMLRGNCATDLYTITAELGAEMLLMGGLVPDRDSAMSLLERKLDDGSAMTKFDEMVRYQGGDLSIFESLDTMPKAGAIIEYKARATGYISEFATEGIGRLIVDMGGGRKVKDDIVNPLVGLVFIKKLGDETRAGESIAEIHARDKAQASMVSSRLDELIKIGDNSVVSPPLVIKQLS
jgi:pyrimidine-nucleoside phosphorylase